MNKNKRWSKRAVRKMNAKKLSQELRTFQKLCITGGIPDLDGRAESICKASVNHENPMVRFISSLGGDSLRSFMAYWDLRDKIQEYQITNNISSVYWERFEWGHSHTFYLPYSDDQLIRMPQDKPILMRNAQKGVNYFLEAAKKFKPNDFKMYFLGTTDTEELEVEIDDPCIISNTLKHYEWVEIHPNTPSTSRINHIDMEGNTTHITKYVEYIISFAKDVSHPNSTQDDIHYCHYSLKKNL